MSFSLNITTGPYGDGGSGYCVIAMCKIENKNAATNFKEINIEYDDSHITGIYKTHNEVMQEIVGTCFKTSCVGYSTIAGESSPYYYFTGWRRINPSDDVGGDLRYASFNRDANHDPDATRGMDIKFTGNRNGTLGRGVLQSSTNMPEYCTVSLSRAVITSKKLYMVVPRSTQPVFGFYTSSRTVGFCNDSKTDSFDDYNNTIGIHSIMNPKTWFKSTTIHTQVKKHDEETWTRMTPPPDFPWDVDAGLTTKVSDWLLFNANQPVLRLESGITKTCTASHNANIGYYHKPYFGCENIKTWNKIGYDYGYDSNTKILAANNHGTLVNVNGSQYLSPVSGVPLFISDTKGTAEVTIKFEKDADHMPDTNSTYVDLYISNQPFKENDLGYNNEVIGPKSGATSRKLLSDQPAGHGSGSIKVNYDDITKLKFDVEKDEPIFINFSAYEPSQTTYRGKCTATLQSDISLTVAN